MLLIGGYIKRNGSGSYVQMIGKLGTVALYVDDQDAAERFWTERVGFEVRAKRSLGATGH